MRNLKSGLITTRRDEVKLNLMGARFMLRKAAAEFFEYLERHNIKDMSELPPEMLQLWSLVKAGQRLEAYAVINEGDPADDIVKGNVIEFKKKAKQACP